MNKFIKLFGIFLVLSVLVTACSDDDEDEVELVGKYEYKNFNFDFKYKGDTITIPILNALAGLIGNLELPSIPASQVVELVNGLAKQAMIINFKNIELKDKNEFNLAFIAKGTEMAIGGTYKATTTTIELDVNKQVLQQLTGLEDWNITKVTFNYTLNKDQLIMVLNWSNIKPLLEDFMKTEIFDDLLKNILSDYLPAALQGMMGTIVTMVKAQIIPEILNNVETLEGTFTLAKV